MKKYVSNKLLIIMREKNMSQNINIRPTKINKVNLATFKAPVLEDLNDIELQLQNLSENQMSQVNFKALTIAKKSENIRASIKMSKAYGEYKVANRYVKLLSIIENGDFNNYTEYKKSVDLALLVTKQLYSQIEKLTENQSYYSANLWKSWSKLSLYFKEKNISINDLFVPCGNFNDIKIKKAKSSDVEEIVNKIVSEFKESISDYQNTTIKEVAQKSLKNISETLTTLLNIKNSTTYHEYWTALKARVALALNDTNLELDNKNNLVEVLDNAKINLYNFGSGSSNLDYKFLENACTALLSDRAINAANSVPEIYEFYQRFYVEDFIKESKKILLSTNMESGNAVDSNNENFKGIKHDITLIANKFKDLEKNEDKKEDLLKLIKNFINESKIERFGKKLKENEVSIILGGYVSIYKSIYSIMQVRTPFSHSLTLEFAAFHLIVEYYIDRKGDVSSDYMEILKNSTERLNCALKKDFNKLNSLPPNIWTGEVKKRLNVELYNEIMSDLKVNLAEIKIAYKNFTNKSSEENLFAEFNNSNDGNDRNNKKVINSFNTLIKLGKDFKYTESLLKVLGFKYAARLINAISVMIASIEKNGYKLPNKLSNEIFSTALGACEIFFEDVINGSDHPEKILEAAFRKIYNDDTLEIKKDTVSFEFIPLEEKLLKEKSHEEIIVHNEKDMIAVERNNEEEEEEYKDKISNIRNVEYIEEEKVENALEKIDNTNLVMSTEKNEEDDEEYRLKQIEIERKRKSLEPQEISYDPDDEEFFAIDYIQEILSDELKEAFEENMHILSEDPENQKAFKEIRRIFHTWKGSGKQVNMYSLGYVGEALNHLYDKRMDMNIPWNSSLENTARVTFDKFNYWANELLEKNKVFFDPSEVFDALSEEEKYYQEHYSKSNELIEDIELTSDLSFPGIINNEATNEEPAVVEPEIVPEPPVVEEPAVVEPEIIPEPPVVEEPTVAEPEIVPESPVVEEPTVAEPEIVPEPPVVEKKDFELENNKQESQLIKLTEVLDEQDDLFSDNKAKVSHEDLTISSLKELSADFDNDNYEEAEIIKDESAEKTFENIGIKKDIEIDNDDIINSLNKENNERINNSIIEEISLLSENNEVSDNFYENVLPNIVEIIGTDDFEESISAFENIFYDIRHENLTKKHIADISETLQKLMDYISERNSENKTIFKYSISHLEESLFVSEVEQEGEEENILPSNTENEIVEKDNNTNEIDKKLDLILEELIQMKERISVVKGILTELN